MGEYQRAGKGERLRGFPVGWYAVAESNDIGRGKHASPQYFGQKLRLYRDKAGAVHATSPAILRRWSLHEQSGLIFAWYHPEGLEPQWELPALPLEGWTGYRVRSLTVRSHPQETSENSVDIGHFVQLHGFRDAWYEKDLDTREHLLMGSYGIGYPLPAGRSFVAKFDVEVHGLGFSLVKIRVPSVGVRIHTLILSTPVDDEHVQVRMGVAVRHWGAPGLSHLIREMASLRLRYEVAQDAPIWESKRYLEQPLLAEGDGPIAAYRRYCRQFYPTRATRGHALSQKAA